MGLRPWVLWFRVSCFGFEGVESRGLNPLPPECYTLKPKLEQAKAKAEKEGFTLGKSTGSFKANSKVRKYLQGVASEGD